LQNAALMDAQLKREVETYKNQRIEAEKAYKELKLQHGKDMIYIRQLKSDTEDKKREIIDASELIERITSELDEAKMENKKTKGTIDRLEKDKFTVNLKYKKLEREIFKSTWDKQKLHSVIQMQKDSISDLQKDYYSQSQEIDYNDIDKRNFEQLPPMLNMTYQGDVAYNYKCQNLSKNNIGKANMMSSFDNILAPLENRTFYDSTSPFSSSKTLNKFGKTTYKDYNGSLERNNTVHSAKLMQDISVSHKAMDEGSIYSGNKSNDDNMFLTGRYKPTLLCAS
jgi:hypothetical protein